MKLKKQQPKNVIKKVKENIESIKQIYGNEWQWQDIPAFIRYQIKK